MTMDIAALQLLPEGTDGASLTGEAALARCWVTCDVTCYITCWITDW